MSENSIQPLLDVIKAKKRQIQESTDAADIEWSQMLNDFQARLENDLSKRLDSAVSSTKATTEHGISQLNSAIQQALDDQRKEMQAIIRFATQNARIAAKLVSIFVIFSGVAILLFLAAVWIYTPTGLMDEPSKTLIDKDGRQWTALLDPSWTQCGDHPCKMIIQKK